MARDVPFRSIGIDPGIRGGICVLSPSGAEFFRFPTMTVGRKTVYDFRALGSLASVCGQDFVRRHGWVVVEEQVAIPNQNSRATFATGMGYGIACMVAAGSGMRWDTVRPQRWQRAVLGRFDRGQSKIRALEVASRLYPDAVDYIEKTFTLKPVREGMVDALMLAEYGRRYLIGGSDGS